MSPDRRNSTLTPGQKKAYDFIYRYISDNGEAPTIPEIAVGLGVDNFRSVTQYLEALERKGMIRRERFQKRNIKLLEDEKLTDLVQLPVFASAGCGSPTVIAERIFDEFINVSSSILEGRDRSKLFVIKAVGKSMEDDGIMDGDYVLVEKTDNEALNIGDRVVAIIDDNAVIKKCVRADELVILSPVSSDPSFKPIIIDKNSVFRVFGKVVKVIKIPRTEEYQYLKIA